MNTLTDLIPDLYAAMDVVSRELTGFIPAVTMDARVNRAAVGQNVTVPIAPAADAEDVVPGTNPPDTGDQDIGNTKITITKARAVPFRWTGEEQLGLNNSGPGYLSIRQDQIAQALRTLVNEVESDLGGLYVRSSRAFGTAGTAPFASDLTDSAQVLKVLKDNGAPGGDLQLIIDTTAGVNLRKMAQLTKANEAGTVALREQGILLPLHSMAVRESAGVQAHVKGTGAGYLVNDAAGVAVGGTAVPADTGTGTIIAGDVATFDADPNNKYVVGSALSGGEFAINAPGARVAIPDDNPITVGDNFTANMAFHRSAMVLAARPPAVPEEGDQATDAMLVTDPNSGLTFEVRMYKQYRRVRYELALAWGVANIKPEHTVLLLG